MTTPLNLHDVHAGIAPSWWPPAPGWWMLAAIILAVAVVAWWWLRRRRRNASLLRLFDDAVDRAETPSQQVAAISELLRRAARHREPAADRLEGKAWLHFLDDDQPGKSFSEGAGALLRDGGFRAEVPEADVAALRVLARQRYMSWMQRR